MGMQTSQDQSPTPPCPLEEQSISVLFSRIESLETLVQKVEQLKSRCAELEATIENPKQDDRELRESCLNCLAPLEEVYNDAFKTFEEEMNNRFTQVESTV